MKSILSTACLFLSLAAMDENEGFVLIGAENSSVEKKSPEDKNSIEKKRSPEDEKKELRKKIVKLQNYTKNLITEIEQITAQPFFSVPDLEAKVNTYNEILNECLESSQLKESEKLSFITSQTLLNQKIQTIKKIREEQDQEQFLQETGFVKL